MTGWPLNSGTGAIAVAGCPNPMPMRFHSTRADVRIVGSLDAAGLDEHRWNALAAQGTNSVFQTYQWHRSWWDTYGRRFEPLVVTVSDGQRTTAVAPLFAEVAPNGTRVVRFMGDGRADYCDLLARNDSQSVAAIVRGLRDYRDWDVIDLGSLPALSPTVAMLRALSRKAGLRVVVYDQFVCPTLVVRGHEPAVRRILNKPSLRRRQNYFEKNGRLGFRDLRAAQEIDPYLETFFDQHTARWRDTDTPSLFNDGSNRAFYRDLTYRLDGTRWLIFSFVEFDNRPIAFHFGFDYNDTLFWYKPSFDSAFEAHSPGLVLIRHLIRRALDDGLRELDFTIGDEPFKRRFTNVIRKTVRVQIYRNKALYAYERSRRGMIAAVRQAMTIIRKKS